MDPWGPGADTNESEVAGFDDSFLPHQPRDEGEYVPLDDSPHYLAGLERKLARVQGRTAATRTQESRRMIQALAASRGLHASELIQGRSDVAQDAAQDVARDDQQHSNGAVDPHGALGSMLRRVAPDRVALSHEELCHLLEADILAKMHEIMEDEAREDEAREDEAEDGGTDVHKENGEMPTDGQEIRGEGSVGGERNHKESSDEGEK